MASNVSGRAVRCEARQAGRRWQSRSRGRCRSRRARTQRHRARKEGPEVGPRSLAKPRQHAEIRSCRSPGPARTEKRDHSHTLVSLDDTPNYTAVLNRFLALLKSSRGGLLCGRTQDRQPRRYQRLPLKKHGRAGAITCRRVRRTSRDPTVGATAKLARQCAGSRGGRERRSGSPALPALADRRLSEGSRKLSSLLRGQNARSCPEDDQRRSCRAGPR